MFKSYRYSLVAFAAALMVATAGGAPTPAYAQGCWTCDNSCGTLPSWYKPCTAATGQSGKLECAGDYCEDFDYEWAVCLLAGGGCSSSLEELNTRALLAAEQGTAVPDSLQLFGGPEMVIGTVSLSLPPSESARADWVAAQTVFCQAQQVLAAQEAADAIAVLGLED